MKSAKQSPIAPRAARQILCYHCSAPVFTDDLPAGSFPPPHRCPACKGTWPPTPEEEKLRIRRREEWSKRQRGRTTKTSANRPSKAELRRLRIEEREEEILSKPLDQLSKQEREWLLKVDQFLHHKTPAGRPREKRNEDWLAKIARAKVLGIRKPTLQELAGIQKPSKVAPPRTQDAYREGLRQLREALKKAKKRRQLPIPPMS